MLCCVQLVFPAGQSRRLLRRQKERVQEDFFSFHYILRVGFRVSKRGTQNTRKKKKEKEEDDDDDEDEEEDEDKDEEMIPFFLLVCSLLKI